MSGWGGDPWLPPGQAVDPLRVPPAGPYGYGYGGPPPPARGSAQRRTAVGLGIASMVLGVVALLVFAAGLATFWVGGFLLWMLTKPLGIGAMLLAGVSILVAATARDSGWGSRLSAMIPGAITLLLAMPGLGSSSEVRADARRSADTPAAAVERATMALARRDHVSFCRELAESVRGPGCARDETLRGAQVDWTAEYDTVRGDGTRALVDLTAPSGATAPQRVRTVREYGAWRLLDVPGLPDACVLEAADPFTCPVRRYGA